MYKNQLRIVTILVLYQKIINWFQNKWRLKGLDTTNLDKLDTTSFGVWTLY